MINLDEIMRQLTANAQAMRELVQTISDEQAQWKPGPEIWSMKEVMEHVYNEERLDFRKHLKEFFNDPPLGWGGSGRAAYIKTESCRQALAEFLREREDSLGWLRDQKSPAWDAAAEVSFGPMEAEITLKAGDVLVSWAAHDILHMRQMIELLYAWNERQAQPYSLQYAGGW